MKIIAVLNQKGGVGKTTTVLNLGVALSRLGKKVLLVDLDPQSHLTYSIGLPAHELEATIYELLKGECRLGEVMQSREGIDIVPASLELSGADIELSGVLGREALLKDALNGCADYDYAILDCPPSLGILTLNALVAANEVYIPIQTEFLSLQGMSKLIETVDVVKRKLNHGLVIGGAICTLYDHRKSLNKEVVDRIREFFQERMFQTIVRSNVALAEAPSHGISIFEYRPDCHGAEDYMNLAKEVVERS